MRLRKTNHGYIFVLSSTVARHVIKIGRRKSSRCGNCYQIVKPYRKNHSCWTRINVRLIFGAGGVQLKITSSNSISRRHVSIIYDRLRSRHGMVIFSTIYTKYISSPFY